jgi:hypothetical protein
MPTSLNSTVSNSTQWLPEPYVTGHKGQAIPEDSIFFAMPPIEIGRVISAETTLTKKQNILTKKISIKTVFNVLCTAFIVIFTFPWGLLVLMLYMIWRKLNEFGEFCSYIGEYGFVSFTIKQGRSSRPKVAMFLFQHDVELHVKTTDYYTNGFYQNTGYYFAWMRGQEKLYQITANCHKRRSQKADFVLHFARAAEIAWNRYRLS